VTKVLQAPRYYFGKEQYMTHHNQCLLHHYFVLHQNN